MISLVLHLAMTLGLLWLQRRFGYRHAPWKLALVWYALGVAMTSVEASTFTGQPLSILTMQGALLEILFALAAGFAFKFAAARKKGLLLPFLVFMLYAGVAIGAAGFLLAWAGTVQGLDL